jgi:SAM-dependent methyltransferase
MYKKFAGYYDDLMWSSYIDKYLDLINIFINEKNIVNKKILDLWCGTGNFLKKLSSENTTYGIDLSKENISIALKKDKKSIYEVWDITDFKIDAKFDIITCCFDTVNHLKTRLLWKKLFEWVSGHLDKWGVFIFDINTIEKFQNIDWKSLVKNVWEDYIIMETNSNKNKCNFKISIFSYLEWCYKLDIENIEEISFKTKEVVNMLSGYFSSINIINDNGDRIFFQCIK